MIVTRPCAPIEEGSSQRLKKWAPVASPVSVHHLRPRAGLVGPVSV